MSDISCETAQGLIEVFTASAVSYPLNYRCAAEFLGTMTVVMFGDAAAANLLLPKTKGHNMGYGPICLAWGMSYFTAFLCFSYVSAYFNPTLLIGDWVLGTIGVGTFFALAACELAGAMVGAIIVWLLYLPHFATQPCPPPTDSHDNLLRTRDYLGKHAQRYAGNKVWVKSERSGLLQDVQYYLQDEYHLPKNVLLEKVLGKDALVDGNEVKVPQSRSARSMSAKFKRSLSHGHAPLGKQDIEMATGSLPGASRPTSAHAASPRLGSTAGGWLSVAGSSPSENGAATPTEKSPHQLLRRYSIQVADLHARLAHLDEEYATLKRASVSTAQSGVQSLSASRRAVPSEVAPTEMQTVSTLVEEKAPKTLPQHGIEGFFVRSRKALTAVGSSGAVSDMERPEDVAKGMRKSSAPETAGQIHKSRSGLAADLLGDAPNILSTKAVELQSAEHEAAMLADQAAKLHVFCTRPSIRAPFWNLVAEFMLATTWMLLFKLLELRGTAIYQSAQSFWPTEFAFIRGWLSFGLMIGLGGPTGFAGNPARDLGPRIVHWFLPLPNKGPSEWSYAPIPVVGPLLGGLAGAGLFAAIRPLWHSSVSATAYLGLLPNST